MNSLIGSWWLRFALLALFFAAIFRDLPTIGMVVLWSAALAAAAATGVGMIRMSSRERGDLRRVRESGHLRSAVDGEVVAVCGTLEPESEVLTSPIRRNPCVLYHYRVSHRGRSKTNTITDIVDYSGYGAVPAVVRGPHLTARLGAFPRVDELPERGITSAPARANIEEFLRFSRFSPLPKGQMLEWIEAMDDMWDGKTVKMTNFRRDDGYSAKEPRLDELSVAPGTQVCAIGAWSDGSVTSAPGRDLFLWIGSREVVQEKLASSIGCGLFFGLSLVAASIAAAIYLVRIE